MCHTLVLYTALLPFLIEYDKKKRKDSQAEDVERESDEEDGLNENVKTLRKTTERQGMENQAVAGLN